MLGRMDKREIKIIPTQKAKQIYEELNEKYIAIA